MGCTYYTNLYMYFPRAYWQPGLIQLGTFQFLILTIVILLILAEVSYQFFEKRFMELGHRFKYNNPTMTVQQAEI